MFKQFSAFIQRGNALDLAVGVLIGAAFTGVVKAITDHFLGPLIGLALGGFDLSNSLIIDLSEDAKLKIGAIIQSVINFLITAFVIFLVVQAYNKATKQSVGTYIPTPTEALLTEIRDLMAAREKAEF